MIPHVTRIRAVRPGYVDLDITPRPGQEAHRIAYLDGEGWFCGEPCHSTRCTWIDHARALTPDQEEQT